MELCLQAWPHVPQLRWIRPQSLPLPGTTPLLGHQGSRQCCGGPKACMKREIPIPKLYSNRIYSNDHCSRNEGGDFAQLSFISFHYALRVPSEALILRRAFKNGELTGMAPMRDQASIGLRGELGSECLIIRFLRRKNLPDGCILSRPCFCKIASPKARRLCLVHAFWPAIAARVRFGEKLFCGYTAQNVNARIKAVLEKLEIPYAQSYTSHGFRRGAR